MQKSVNVLLILSSLMVFISLNSVSAYNQNFSCNIVPAANCNASVGGNIIMGLSALSNAIAQFPYPPVSGPSYPDVLCCYFGNGNTTCSSGNNYYGHPPQNEIVGLTSNTDAHAQDPSQTPVPYAVPVCYSYNTNGPLQCISTNSGCPIQYPNSYPINIMNLSNYTNARIGTGAGFNTAICCNVAGLSGIKCNLTSATWEYNNAMQGVQVGLNITGANCGGAEIKFNITDSNGKQVNNNPSDVTFPINSLTTNNVTSTWTAEYHTGQPNQYKFIAIVLSNGNSIVSGTPNQNTALNGTLAVSQQPVGFCTTINTCADYNSSATCNSDNSLCSTALKDPNVDPNAYASLCEWNTSSNVCQFENIYQGNGSITCGNGFTLCTSQNNSLDYCYPGNLCPSGNTPLSNGNGICDFGEGCSSVDCNNNNQDSCSLGSVCQSGMCYNSTTTPVNATQCGNQYTLCYNSIKNLDYCYSGSICPSGDNAPTGSCASSAPNAAVTCTNGLSCNITGNPAGYCSSSSSAVGKCVFNFINSGTTTCTNGFLTYKWTATWSGSGNQPANCKGGSAVIECPAQIPLPFFNIYNAAITLVIIILIYIIIILARKKTDKRRKMIESRVRHKTSRRRKR